MSDLVELGKKHQGVDPGLDLDEAIRRLKRERNAVVLAHYYQDDDIQDVADFLGEVARGEQHQMERKRSREEGSRPA